jgi:predicted nucleic acid-binding protein
LTRVFFDSNLFIYWLEDKGELSEKVARLIERMLVRRDQIVTSTLTVGEVLAKPLELGMHAVANRYERLLSDPAIVVVPFDQACAVRFARLRARFRVKAPDAIQLACAAQAHCTLFLTHDKPLAGLAIPDIDFVLTLDAALQII